MKNLFLRLLEWIRSFIGQFQTETLHKPEIAVLLIDMQEKFLEEVDKRERTLIIAKQREVIEFCRDNNLILITIIYKGQGPTTFRLADIIRQVPRSLKIEKEEDDSFDGTCLEETLDKLRVSEVFLMGVFASACVRATACGAIKAGFKFSTCEEVIADRIAEEDSRRDAPFYIRWGKYFRRIEDFFEYYKNRGSL